MLYRRFGKTNIQMPVFSCGGMRYQHKWQDVALSEVPSDGQANLEATVRRAVEVGINHIETARGYGSSERQLGLILPKLPRDKIIVQTKIAPESDPAVFVANFRESLSRLKLDYVDLLALHGVNDAETLDWAIRPHGCLAAARELQRQGLARHIGFSTHAPTSIIMSAITGADAHGGFDYVNLHWFYIAQGNWPAIQEATRRDMGVFIISPSDKGGLLYRPSATLEKLTAPLHPMVFNDLFCLSHPQVHTLSIGASRPSDFDKHLETLPLLDSSSSHLSPILARLEARWNSALTTQWRDLSALSLPLPENTPGNINLPIILWLRNLVKAYDMTEFARMRYNLLGQGGHWFPGQNAAAAAQVDLSAIAQTTGLGSQLVEALVETHALLSGEQKKRLSQGD